MLDQPARHGSCLFIVYPDCIVNELSSDIEIVSNAIDTNALNDRVNLVAATCAFSLFWIEHYSILDTIEKTTPRGISEYDLDIRKT